MGIKESLLVDGSPSAVLASVRDNRARAEAAQLAVLFDALDWAAMGSISGRARMDCRSCGHRRALTR